MKNKLPTEKTHYILKQIFGNNYDEQIIQSILKQVKEKVEFFPGISYIVHHINLLLNSGKLSEEETKFVKDFLETIIKHRKDNDEIYLPSYLTNIEDVYQYSSWEKSGAKGDFYEEEYFVERNIDGVKEVWYIEIKSNEKNALFKSHKLINEPKLVCVKTEIRRLLQQNDTIRRRIVYEVIINDEFIFAPPFNYKTLGELVRKILNAATNFVYEQYDYIENFNTKLFQRYLDLKLREYHKKSNGKPIYCIISNKTGWNDDNTMFFHYDLNDEQHELSKDNPLYEYNKAVSFNQEEQHKLVFDLLQEGKLLGVLLTISAASILLKPLDLTPIPCIITGRTNIDTTIPALIATSLFYKSDEILIEENVTRLKYEKLLSSLNSLPLVIDEYAISDTRLPLLIVIHTINVGMGKTRARRVRGELIAEAKELKSNVFIPIESMSLDILKRPAVFRRVLHIKANKFSDFTKLFDLSSKDTLPHEQYAGCGVDYIKYVIANLDKIKNNFEREAENLYGKYEGLTEIALTLYAGVLLLEEFYSHYYNLVQPIQFTQLRKTIDNLLENAAKTFVALRDEYYNFKT